MSGGVKFVTGSGLASTPCHLNYSPNLSCDWANLVTGFCSAVGFHTTWSKICVGDGGAF